MDRADHNVSTDCLQDSETTSRQFDRTSFLCFLSACFLFSFFFFKRGRVLHNYVSHASLHQPVITILTHGPLHTLHLCTPCTYLVIAMHYIFSLGQVTETLTQRASNLGTSSFSFLLLRSNDPKPKMPFTGESSEEFEKRITQQLLQL